MGIGASLFLIAIGAICEYALPNSVAGVHLGTIGVILMIVGVLGLAVAVFVNGPRSRSATVEPRRVVEPEREVVVERPVERESHIVTEREAGRPNRPW